MTIFEALILGILQGATEFLPVSSSGHLVLIPAVFNLQPAGLTAVAIAHQGTLLAVLLYFYKDLWQIVTGVLRGLADRRPVDNPNAKLGWLIVFGSIPAAFLGLLFEDFFEELFGEPAWAAGFLLVTAALLVIGERMRSGHKPQEEMTWLDTFIIGLFQGLALFPGISRSGSTIVGGLLRGFDRSTAARYSFLLGIPAILGAGLLSILDLLTAPDLATQITPLIVVFVAAAVSGYACIHWLLQWVKVRGLIPFAVYCALFGVFYLVVYVALG
ncbi:MAG: undecaprenyl-diphosphatase UppP [Ardenticatenaceae bacterium]|nr:undecaprenyl-diphosphatase UppP [Ardenticatenaceae bacterium]